MACRITGEGRGSLDVCDFTTHISQNREISEWPAGSPAVYTADTATTERVKVHQHFHDPFLVCV